MKTTTTTTSMSPNRILDGPFRVDTWPVLTEFTFLDFEEWLNELSGGWDLVSITQQLDNTLLVVHKRYTKPIGWFMRG